MQICKTQRKVWVPLIPLLTWFATFVFLSAAGSLSCGYGIYHRVKKGETLYKISKKYNVPVEEIIKANKESPFRFNPDKLKPGDYVYIPLDKAKAQKERTQQEEKGKAAKKKKKVKTEPRKTIKQEKKKLVSKEKKKALTAERKQQETKWKQKKKPPAWKRTTKKTESKALAGIPRKTVRKKLRTKKRKGEGRRRITKSGKVPLSFMFPIDGGRIISRFGKRGRRMHKGIDIKAPEGTPVRASEDGVVIFSGFLRGYGNVIIIKHEGNYFTVYAHNKYNIVKEGEFVRKGQTIAKVGRTGNATTPHLHFEIRRKTKPLNPLVFLK